MDNQLGCEDLIAKIKQSDDNNFHLFLGAGASASSGIKTGSELVWDFKKELYCLRKKVSPNEFNELSDESKKLLQKYFDNEKSFPPRGSPEEYSIYFKEYLKTPEDRNKYIQNLVKDKEPKIGYQALGKLVIEGKFKNIWTTNFDELSENGIKKVKVSQTVNVYSSINTTISITDNQFPSVYKLHGDFRYDNLKNTSDELQQIERILAEEFKKKLINHGLIVIGYSGNDESIKKLFDEGFSNKDFLNKGLYWLCTDINTVSDNVKNIICKAKEIYSNSCLIEISNFDSFMKDLYIYLGYNLSELDSNYPKGINSNSEKTEIEIERNNKNIPKKNNKDIIQPKDREDEAIEKIATSSEDTLNIVQQKDEEERKEVQSFIFPKKIEKNFPNIYIKQLIDEEYDKTTLGTEVFKETVIDFFQNNEWEKIPNIVLRGIAGIGKTLELHKTYNEILDLTSKNLLKNDCIPVFINLSNYTSSVFSFITFNTKFLLFIDGVDEIIDSVLIKIEKQIDDIISRYANVRIILSVRNNNCFNTKKKELKFRSFCLQQYIESQDKAVNVSSNYIVNDINGLKSIPLYRNIIYLDLNHNYKELLQNILKRILIDDKKRFDKSLNITYRRDDLSKIDLTITETYLIKIAAYQISKNQLFISEKELVNLINNKDQFEFLLKSSLFSFKDSKYIYFVSELFLYYYFSLSVLQKTIPEVKNMLFTASGKVKEKKINSIQYLLLLLERNSKIYRFIINNIKKETPAYILLTDYEQLLPIERFYNYKLINEDFNKNQQILYYGRFTKSHDLLQNVDSLSDSLHKLLPKEHYNDAVKLHRDTILSFIENPTVDKITYFKNAVILLGVHDNFWTERQYKELQDISIPLIKFFRENELAIKMKGLLSEDIILSWYEDYGWAERWQKKEWQLFFKKITNIETNNFYSFKSEDDFRLKLKFFIHFHKNIYIRNLLVPLTVKILEKKDLVDDDGSFVPSTLDDDFSTPTIHFDNDISYFTFVIENYEIPISDILYILNSVECNYIHYNSVYQLEELYKKITSQLENRISQLSEESLPEFYKLFNKYINADDGIYIADFNKYIKLLSDNQKINLFDLLLNDLVKNVNWQKLWMLHQSIVILLDITNIEKACLLSDKLKSLDRVYGECIANIYVGKLDMHPLYETALSQYPILYPETVKKEEKRQIRLSEIETKILKMQEKEIDVITRKEVFLDEVKSIFSYLDETQDISNRDTDRGNLLDLQTDYIYNKVQYDYKDYNIPPIFSSFAIKFLFNSTDENQKLNREETLKNIEDWFSSEKYFWRYFFWLFICHYKKEESDKFLEDNPVLIEKIKESMEQEVSYFIEENDISIYDGGRNRFWVVPFVHYLSRFYNNKLPDWFDKNKILNFIAYPAWQLSTGYGVHINGEFKWQSWDSVFDWIETVSGFSEDVIIEKALSLLSELKSDQSQTQVITVFVEKVKSVSAYKQQMLNAIIDKTIVEIQKDYKDHSNTSIMNGGALSSFWRETQEDLIDKLYPYVDFSKYNPDDINYCRRSVFEYICKNANKNERKKIIESLKNRISEKIIRIYLTKLGYDKAIIQTINEFLNGENFNTDYAFYSPLFGKTKASLRLLSKYFQLYKYSLEKSNDRRNYLIGYAKEGILQTTTKKNFWFIKKNFNHLIKRLKKEGRYFEGVEDFLNEIEQKIFDDD